MKMYFIEELVITEEDNKIFESFIKYWICDIFVERQSKFPSCFSIKKIMMHILLCKNLAKGFEKYMSFSLNNKLVFIDNFQLFSFFNK